MSEGDAGESGQWANFNPDGYELTESEQSENVNSGESGQWENLDVDGYDLTDPDG